MSTLYAITSTSLPIIRRCDLPYSAWSLIVIVQSSWPVLMIPYSMVCLSILHLLSLLLLMVLSLTPSQGTGNPTYLSLFSSAIGYRHLY